MISESGRNFGISNVHVNSTVAKCCGPATMSSISLDIQAAGSKISKSLRCLLQKILACATTGRKEYHMQEDAQSQCLGKGPFDAESCMQSLTIFMNTLLSREGCKDCWPCSASTKLL